MSGPAPLLVTGGAGFIGSALVRRLLAAGERVVNLDRLTYAGRLESLGEWADHPRHVHLRIDIADGDAVHAAFEAYQPRAVLHLAAESHVDRSIDGPDAFVFTNVLGTLHLLQAARAHFRTLSGEARDRFRFLHVSTDEVFGTLDDVGRFDAASPYAPRSPYAASKAGSDHLARAWHHTYGLPVIVTNCSNNFGPRQHPEKLIPLMLLAALAGRELPVYGDGRNVRDWLYVEDHVDGLLAALERGRPGASYLFGGAAERENLEVVRGVCALLDELRPDPAGSYARLIRFVQDRPGHDFRYAIDPACAEAELGWRARHRFEDALRETVAWYLANEAWWRGVEWPEGRPGLPEELRR